jgi:hypothetical protein
MLLVRLVSRVVDAGPASANLADLPLNDLAAERSCR